MASIEKPDAEAVAAYFVSTAPRWEQFYAHPDKRVVYSTIYRSRLERALALVDRLGLPAWSRCLDIGCGPGIGTVALAQRGFAVDAVDLIQAQLDRTRRRAVEAGADERIATSIGDDNRLDFPDGTFDLALVIGVMEWQVDPNKSLREISRVLKPGGHALLSVDNRRALRNWLDPFAYRPVAALRRWAGKILRRSGLRRDSGASPRDHSYSIRDFDQLVANAGLEKLQGATIGFGPFPFLDLELPPSLGLPVHRAFQRLADRGVPLLRSGGLVYLTAAKKQEANVRRIDLPRRGAG
jgi:SAM-dependent methyltransferase